MANDSKILSLRRQDFVPLLCGGKNIDKAVVREVDYSLENGYLVEFLTKYSNEVIVVWVNKCSFGDSKEENVTDCLFSENYV